MQEMLPFTSVMMVRQSQERDTQTDDRNTRQKHEDKDEWPIQLRNFSDTQLPRSQRDSTKSQTQSRFSDSTDNVKEMTPTENSVTKTRQRNEIRGAELGVGRSAPLATAHWLFPPTHINPAIGWAR